VTLGGKGLSLAAAAMYQPRFTLASLSADPVSPAIEAWRSCLLTGAQSIPPNPVGGPGTPSLPGVKQPGVDAGGTTEDLGDGLFRYTFGTALPATPPVDASSCDPAGTLRVGLYLGAPARTRTPAATRDFSISGDVAVRDTVSDEACNRCHGDLRAHGEHRVGVRLCLTCHTYQLADPDTADPAAQDGASGPLAATNPNPLDLGRLVHRIHRGRSLPTLYRASATAPANWPPSATALPHLPFSTTRTGASAQNPPLLGRKYSIVGHQSRELVYGRVIERRDNFHAPVIRASGIAFPRDLRDCGACHGDAPQRDVTTSAISRRTCSGCHPDVWFGTEPITDPVHFAHSGGPQADDAECAGCHVAPTATQPTLWAPIADIHVPPAKSPRSDRPVAALVAVEGLVPGGAPTVTFRLHDRVGVLSPPGAPEPAGETGAGASPVGRRFDPANQGRLKILLAGPTAPDFVSGVAQPLSSVDADLLALTSVDPVTGAASSDPATAVFRYTFPAGTVPPDAKGTWAVSMEARRRMTGGPCASPAAPGGADYYDPVTAVFPWPGTGECVTESPDNPIAYVDTAAGTWAAGGAPSGSPVPRRRVVEEQRCLVCHDRFELHGSQRHQVEYCLFCHTPDKTDWGTPLGASSKAGRPKLATGDPLGNVDRAATFDGIEERSIHLKVLLHRIHTGGRSGSATLEGIAPFVVYGYGQTPYFFDEGGFPNDLADCALCHVGRSYAIEAVPADAPPTTANESASILHAGTAAHAAAEAASAVPPVQAACLGCHASGAAFLHAARHTTAGAEQCASCHVRGGTSVDAVHGITP
jgi:OmcA/MtrC family decaheme c-type cytochrome